MAKKSKIAEISIKESLLKSPKELISAITSNYQGLRFTKVLSTYIMESKDLVVQLLRDGKNFMEGNLIWLGNRTDNKDGVVLCIQQDKKVMKQILPTEDNTLEALFDTNKAIIKITTVARINCAVCGKPIEIFDEEYLCPICEAKAHSDHLRDWIKMRGSCPVCQKTLSLDKKGIPIIPEE